MSAITIQVPRWLVLESTIQFANELASIPEADEYIFDFSKVGRIEPFALLFLSSEIQRFKSSRGFATHRAVGYEVCGYAAHMGFFKAFGLDHGKKPGEAKGSNTYIPIRILNSEKLKSDAAENFEAVGAFIETKAQEMSEMLCRTDHGNLFDTLTYSIREIVRNVVEHSESKRFGLCAQYWPSYNSVELAILDRGVGIRESLQANKSLVISDDHEALNLSLMPGVTSKPSNNTRRRSYDVWANSGFGLYMTSRLCREGGSFFIASGTTGVYLSETKRKYLNTPFKGTALRLTLNTTRLATLYDRLEKYREEANISNGQFTASLASHMLSRDFKQ